MTYKYWGGHGWTEACDETNPTGRFFTAMIALTETSPDKAWPDIDDIGGNILRWGAGWAARVHDDTRARCAYNGEDAIATAHNCGTPWHKYTSLWIPNHFYSTNKSRWVVSRASTVVHEAAHINGKCHNGDDGKDSSWGYDGGWTYQAAWLSQYASEGIHAPIEQKCRAEDQANQIVSDNFEDTPSFAFDAIDDTLCP